MIKVHVYKEASTQVFRIQGWSYITKERASEEEPIPGETYYFRDADIPLGFFKNYENYCIRDSKVTPYFPTVKEV